MSRKIIPIIKSIMLAKSFPKTKIIDFARRYIDGISKYECGAILNKTNPNNIAEIRSKIPKNLTIILRCLFHLF